MASNMNPGFNNMGKGIMAGVYSVLGPQIQRENAIEDEMRTKRSDMLYKTIEETPNLTPEEIDKYLGEIEALYPKRTREVIKQSHDKIRQIIALGNKQKEAQKQAGQQAQTSAANAVASDTTPATSPMPTMPGAMTPPPAPSQGFTDANNILSANGLQPATPPTPVVPPNPIPGVPVSSETAAPVTPSIMPPPPSATAELLAQHGNVNRGAKISRESIKESMEYWRKNFKSHTGEEVDDNTLYNLAVGKNALPSMLKLGKVYVGEDGYQYTQIVNPDGTISELKSQNKVQEKIFRPVSKGEMSIKEAIKARDDWGAEFKDQDGTDLPLDKMDPSLKIQHWVAGSKHYYNAAQQTQTTKDISGRIIGKNQYDIIDPSAGTVLGQATSTLPRSTTREQLAITPEGQTVAQTLTGGRTTSLPPLLTNAAGTPSTTTPPVTSSAPANVSPGASSVISAPPSVSGTQPTTTAKPTTPVSSSSRAPVVPEAVDANKLPAGTRAVGAMPTTIYNTQQKRIVAIREASNQIFGDPSQPDFVPLKAYADLANKPDAAKRVGNAVQATLKEIEQAEKSHGSIVNLLKAGIGIPQLLVQAQTGVVRSLIPTDPKEHAAYTATINAYSNLVGLRILTGAGAYESSVSAIQKELPIIGVNVHDSKQFYGMLTKLAEDIWGGARTTVKGMFPQNEIDHYHAQVGEMTRAARGGPTPPPGSNSTSKPKIIEYDETGKRR